MMTIDDLRGVVESVYTAYREKDDGKVFDISPDVMSIYLEAINDVHFGGDKVVWINEIVSAIDEGDGEKLIRVLEGEADSDDRFLGSHVAALFAGFRQNDSLVTVSQATGIKALLENM